MKIPPYIIDVDGTLRFKGKKELTTELTNISTYQHEYHKVIKLLNILPRFITKYPDGTDRRPEVIIVNQMLKSAKKEAEKDGRI